MTEVISTNKTYVFRDPSAGTVIRIVAVNPDVADGAAVIVEYESPPGSGNVYFGSHTLTGKDKGDNSDFDLVAAKQVDSRRHALIIWKTCDGGPGSSFDRLAGPDLDKLIIDQKHRIFAVHYIDGPILEGEGL